MDQSPIVKQRHLNDYGYACINGYKGTFADYMQWNYSQYCSICKNCGIEPMKYEEWRTL